MKSFILVLFSHLILSTTINAQTLAEKSWLPHTNFSFPEFINPELKYGPFTRWWWPGNDVTKEEIKREIKLFADNHFGGVEIQPFALVMPTKGPGRSDRIMGYDTPGYYENLRFTLEEALKSKLTVDLTDGSGWPAGGSHLTENDNNLTLEYGISDIPDQNSAVLNVPRAMMNDHPKARLVALLAAKLIRDATAESKTFILDPKSIVDITSKITDSTFSFTHKGTDWKAISFWAIPDMEKPMLIAKRNSGFVMNHFDSLAVLKNYNYLFGQRTGLQPYFGKPLRAIFDDSYEFKANRHFSNDFLQVFKTNRGYDITKMLPVNIWPGYNNMYYRMANPGQKVVFSFDKEDWRLRYDYDLTLSDVIGKQFLKTTRNWTESRGLLHRTQAYGFNMDIMAMAGLASIPEMETMQFNKGSEGAYKLISSGAHLYNRPVVSSEAMVYINRAFLSTPQKIKMTIDKLLASGANQIIYHGFAYQYYPEGYPKEGWFPFYNSALGINFSDNFNESNPFWKYMKPINQYIQRAQYVLRSGKSNADVLIYYPFLNYTEEVGNPKEVLLNGVMADTEPLLKAENSTASYARPIEKQWVEKIWPFLNELNASGITWDWVNDASIKEIKMTADKKLSIRGNEYQSIVLFNLPYIQLESAQNLNAISKKGSNILAVGNLPKIQPSYLNYVKNDQKTEKEIIESLRSKYSTHITDISKLSIWKSRLAIPLKYTVKNDAFRQARRIMENGDIAQFIWNESDRWQETIVSVTQKLPNIYSMNAEDGSIENMHTLNGKVTITLPPFGSKFLLATTDPIKLKTARASSVFEPKKANSVLEIKNWDISAGAVTIKNSPLFNWRNNDKLKYSSDEAIYSAVFSIERIESGSKYFIDLGKVYYSAEVSINGKPVKELIYTPFILDATAFLKTGKNVLTVKITPAKYNDFVEQANKGEKLYKKLIDSELMSQGLIGPVNLYQQK